MMANLGHHLSNFRKLHTLKLKQTLLTEQQIITNCQRGIKSSQYELVRRYSQMLMTVCRRYAPDESIAKDILQESLIKVFKNIDSYQPTGYFEAWMRKITVRCALHWLRKSYLDKEINLVEMDQDQSVEPAIWSQLGTEEIINLIQELPTGFRTVFNLYNVEGMSHKEISVLLNITESASRSQLARARKLLQNKLNAINHKQKLA